VEASQRARLFEERGYVVARGFFARAEMAELVDEIRAADAADPRASGLSRGELRFYSNVFRRSERLRGFLSQPRLVDFLTPVVGPDFFVRWDQAVEKGPGAPTFPWHQDNGYSGLLDAHYQLWIALTDGTKDNGGLWLAPGSHRSLLPHRRVGAHRAAEVAPEQPLLVEAEAGDVVLFSSLLLHRTLPNVSDAPRWAYVIEYMSTRHFDPSIQAPYLMVARNGRPRLEWRRLYRGRLGPWNQLKYLPRRALPPLRRGLRAAARGLVPERLAPRARAWLRRRRGA
jgi:hypothetical protein